MDDQKISLDWLVSVDDHVLEPAHVWQDRIPARYRDAAPRLVRDGSDEFWLYEGKRVPTLGLSAVAGKATDEFSPEPMTYADMRPGCYDSKSRLDDMDRAGIIASMCFPSFPRFCGQIFWEADDKELALLCIRAYNDWMIEEWCGAAPDRFIPLTLIPLWDPNLAAAEMERCAAMGSHAFAFSENPEPLGLPTIHDPAGYWDPVMAAANDLEMVVCMHVGSSSTMPKISSDAPFMANLAWGAVRTSGAMLTWLFSDYIQRHDNLKLALSEGEIGWIPFFLERAEQVYDKQRHWVQRGVSFKDHAGKSGELADLDLRQLFKDHFFGCFIDDVHGLRNLDAIGEDNVMIETDYPHSDSTWPDSIKIAQQHLASFDPVVQHKILRGNAERLFHFQAAAGA